LEKLTKKQTGIILYALEVYFMGLAAKEQFRKYTYGDYLAWDDDERWEIINGTAFDMSPGPGTTHQSIVTELIRQLGNQLEEKPCRVFTAPFDVRLPRGDEKEEEIENVVQPDISIICDKDKLDEKGCLGAPDVVMEILSPSTYRKDKLEKFNLYEEAGVKEYWLVSYTEKIVEVFTLDENNRFGRPDIHGDDDTVEIKTLENLTVDLSKIFQPRDIK
jgi:Uma2 family endonuclease